MIVNCGVLGLDYERASLSDYLEALSAHNEMNSDEKPARQVSDDDRNRLAAVMAARG